MCIIEVGIRFSVLMFLLLNLDKNKQQKLFSRKLPNGHASGMYLGVVPHLSLEKDTSSFFFGGVRGLQRYLPKKIVIGTRP
jgi:hypothetical protein